MTTDNQKDILICLLLIFATFLIYWDLAGHDFVNVDDNIYVTNNDFVKSGLTPKNVKWAFTTTRAEFWHPVTWISYMLDTQVFGVNPGGYLFTNLILHVLNSILVFLVLKKMTSATWQSGFVAALFALHPLHVESVAWIAERKDVLSTFWGMLTILFYSYYVNHQNYKRYLIVCLSFALCLASKPMLVTLPFLLVLIDFWPLGRLKLSTAERSTVFTLMRLLLEKTPLFIMSATSATIAFFVQKNAGGIVTADNYTFINRVANAILSYATYIGKMLWPEHLAVFYPYVESIPGWRLAGSMALLILLSALAILWIRRYPFFIVGWSWYIGSLIPVIGLVKIGDFAMADRYTYIPLIGLFIIIAWGLPEVFRNSRYKKAVLGPLAAAVLVILAIVASSQVRHWTNSQTLFEHALKVTKKNFFAHYALGNSLMSQGKSDKAIKHFSEAARIKPDKAPLHIDLGRALASRGNFKEAFPHFRKALEIDPNKANIHYYLGVVLVKQKKMNDAIEHFLEALRLSPEFKNNETCVDERRFNDLSNKRKDSHEVLDTSIDHYDQILSYQPGCLEALMELASAYSQKEKYSEALSLLKIEKSNEGLRRAAIEGIRHWELLESSK